jgi:hypothetical protein
VLETTKE